MSHLIDPNWRASLKPVTGSKFWLDVAGTIMIPYVIFYLSLFGGMRALKLALLPFGYIAAFRVLFLGGLDTQYSAMYGNQMFNLVAGSATRWALSDLPPDYQPTTEPSPFPTIRQSTAYKALSMMLNVHRHVGIKGFIPLRSQGKTRLQYIRHHFIRVIISRQLWTEFVYLVYLFSGATYSAAPATDLYTRMQDFQRHSGIPPAITRTLFAVNIMIMIKLGLEIVWHASAVLMIGSGLWNGEEFPRLINSPLKSTSLTEFWGKRYHQLNRDTLSLWSNLFKPLGRTIQLFSVFLISGVQHYTIYHTGLPIPGSFTAWSSLFLGCGFGIMLERLWYKRTGRHVSGPPGLMWMLLWTALICQPMVCWYWQMIIVDQMPNLTPTHSAVGWILWYTGLAPRPGTLSLHVDRS
ncbi:hypothetical protein BD324DRAFT_633989 [Kockovaella imperatae]|uniref:Wax synthase domain-containing protein n=1 Tax=Kockovaella imperatae TaxID=4999 RepID=A0A1Y1UAV4_9TREE|nr:hypothetical protein BD324DRAFT_633989 [Kockovaella imperatae]ORX35132.1 hypothetical protein BD324DRAFT_633989 [Kockovaella imperatae]